MQNPEYKHRPVAALAPYARNARTHSDEQVDKIAASIKRWQDFTGQQAVHEETGKTFDEVANANASA